MSFTLFQAAPDDRWARVDQLLSDIGVVEVEQLVEAEIAGLESIDPRQASRERIGGGLDEMSDAVLEHPDLAAWSGWADWRCLCVVDADRLGARGLGDKEADSLAAVVSDLQGTGVWASR